MVAPIVLKASYTGPLNNDKELELFQQLKATAAAEYPLLQISGSWFEVSKDAAGVEHHVHYLTLFDPAPENIPAPDGANGTQP